MEINYDEFLWLKIKFTINYCISALPTHSGSCVPEVPVETGKGSLGCPLTLTLKVTHILHLVVEEFYPIEGIMVMVSNFKRW